MSRYHWITSTFGYLAPNGCVYLHILENAQLSPHNVWLWDPVFGEEDLLSYYNHYISRATQKLSFDLLRVMYTPSIDYKITLRHPLHNGKTSFLDMVDVIVFSLLYKSDVLTLGSQLIFNLKSKFQRVQPWSIDIHLIRMICASENYQILKQQQYCVHKGGLFVKKINFWMGTRIRKLESLCTEALIKNTRYRVQ